MTKKGKAYAYAPVVLADVSIIAGACSVSYGAWLFSQPLGFMVGGLLAMALAFAVGARA